MVDGKQRPAAEAGFDTVLACFEGLPCPAYHLVGNHDLYNLPRPRLNERCVADVAGGGAGTVHAAPARRACWHRPAEEALRPPTH